MDIDSEACKRPRILQATKKKYGFDNVLNICTFKSEGSKSAMLTAARGLGIDNDISQYLSNMIPIVRGNTTSLNVMINGDEETDTRPNTQFLNECANYPGLLETALGIEGLVCGRSIHASGVIIYPVKYVEHNAMMRAPNGQEITQWDMDDSTYCGGLKTDMLTVVALDSMHTCYDFLMENGHIEKQGSFKETYNHYFHPDALDYETKEMWEMAEKLEIVNLFQFSTGTGSEAIQKIKPRSLSELSTANSAMRLMVERKQNQDEAPEQPLDTFVRYKNDINEWYKCMRDDYHLTDFEINVVEQYLKPVFGVASMQEEIMRLSMDEHISGFSMLEANTLRKSIAKKKKKLQDKAKKMFYEKGREIGASDNLLNYVWIECIGKQLGLNKGSSKTWETHFMWCLHEQANGE